MKISERFIYIFIIILALGYITFTWFGGDDIDLKPYEDQIENLKKQLSERDNKLDSINVKIDSFPANKKRLDSLLNDKDLKIEELIQRYNEKINNIDNYSNGDIRSFFTNRYPE